MALCSISVVPVGTGSTSVSRYVARCHEVLARLEGIAFRLTPMSTIIEGDLDAIFDAAARLHRVPFEEGAERVLTTMIIDDRADKPVTMDGKIASVMEKLRRGGE
ncbi:MAG: MTH1187 family thiamine-binding protein [Candidatus Krumholzibacteria bacterium]|nr:MTH1187 family thiamine-binding protein [Candidatus Krumholzibacteria bacterium]